MVGPLPAAGLSMLACRPRSLPEDSTHRQIARRPRAKAGAFVYDSAFGYMRLRLAAMPQSGEPEQDLAEVHRRIVAAEVGVTRQITMMNRLARAGRDTADAHALLNEMKGALAGMYTHRSMLVRRFN